MTKNLSKLIIEVQKELSLIPTELPTEMAFFLYEILHALLQILLRLKIILRGVYENS